MPEKVKIYLITAVFAVCFALVLQFDFLISHAATSLRTGLLDSAMLALTSTIFQVILFAATSILVYLKDKKHVLHLWLSAVFAYAISIFLKIIIARPRPFSEGIISISSLIKDSYTSWDLSFPSNHAIIAFVALAFVPKKWFWLWLIIVLLISFSRVYFGLHYLSDVMAGAAIGLTVSYFIKKKVKL